MAILEDVTKVANPAGLAIGAGAALLVPVLAPALSQWLRPAAKAAMRTGITLYRSTMEPITAAVGDLVTEAQLELAASSATAAPEEPSKPSRHKRRESAGES